MHRRPRSGWMPVARWFRVSCCTLGLALVGGLGLAGCVDPARPIADPDLAVVTPGDTLFSDVASGMFHSCALTVGGRAFCWGLGSSGQLGTGDRPAGCASEPTLAISCLTQPTPVAGGLRFAQIAAGADDTCGITPSGRLYCWGGSPGASPGSLAPTAVGGTARFTAVSVGSVICAIGTDTRTYCWGPSTYAQLGVPMGSPDPGLGEAQPVAGDHVFATVHVPIGYPLPGAVVPVTNSAVCGTTAVGALYCWGGDADTARFEIAAVDLQGCPVGRPAMLCTSVPAHMRGPDQWSRRTAVGFPCAVTTTGGLSCWGTVFRGWGSAPTGRTDSSDVLAKEREPIPLLLPTPVRDIVGAATLSGACAHAVDGRVVCWGKSVSGQFGSGVVSDSLGVPTIVAGGRAFTRLSGGYLFMCGLTSAGEILCWGDATGGVLGIGPDVPPSANNQRPVPTPTRIASIAGR